MRKCNKLTVRPWTTESGFRLIRVFSIEHNTMRFRKHCERLKYRPDMVRSRRKTRVRVNRLHRLSVTAGRGD